MDVVLFVRVCPSICLPQVDEALCEIHESISELAMLLQKDEISSQLVQTAPSQWEQSPASSIASDRLSLMSADCPMPGSHRRDSSSPETANSCQGQQQGSVKLASATDYQPVQELRHMNSSGHLDRINANDSDFEKAGCNGDLSYDLSMSYSILGKSRATVRGSGVGADNVEWTNLSMNLSQEDVNDREQTLINKPILEDIVEDPHTHSPVDATPVAEISQLVSTDPTSGREESCKELFADLVVTSHRTVMADCVHPLQFSSENISVTVSDVSGSLHDTCEYSKCEASRMCSPSPKHTHNQIMPKDSSFILSPAVAAPATARAGLGIKFKQPQRGNGFPVAAVVPGGPADCAGIRAGDILMFVAHNTMTTESTSKHVATSIAQSGTALHVILRRGSALTAALVTRVSIGGATIGTAIAKDPSRNPHVCSVASGSPAEAAGILAGDEVVAVGTQCVASLEREHLLGMLMGEHGSLVVLGIVRPGAVAGLEWMALRRRYGLPMHVPESNPIVPKSSHSPVYAQQNNNYVTSRVQGKVTRGSVPVLPDVQARPTFTSIGHMPRDEYQSQTIAAAIKHYEPTSPREKPERAAPKQLYPAMHTGTLSHSRGTGSNCPEDPVLHAAAHDPVLFSSGASRAPSHSSFPETRSASATRLSDAPGVNNSRQGASVLAHSVPALRHSVPASFALHSVPAFNSPPSHPVIAVGGATVSINPDLYSLSSRPSSRGPAPPEPAITMHSARTTSAPTRTSGLSSFNICELHGVGYCGAARSGLGGSDAAARGRERGMGQAVLGNPVEVLLSRDVEAFVPRATFNSCHLSSHPSSARGDIYSSSSSSAGPQLQLPYLGDAGTARSRSLSTALYTSGGGRNACSNAVARGLERDTLVAPAVQHIHYAESRNVVRTEHSRRLDTDISCAPTPPFSLCLSLPLPHLSCFSLPSPFFLPYDDYVYFV